MRTVPRDLEPKLGSAIQTRANNSAPSVHAIISRATIPLTDENFLERQLVLESSIEDVSIAVSHPKANAQNSQVFVGSIENGVAKVYGAMCKLNMANHTWVDYGFSEPAEAISVAFDGTMPKAVSGDIEFVTEEKPWVFWIHNGVLYAKKLGTTDTIVLAESNCEDVSAVRAMWSEAGSFDFGLCVFFILSGSIYYRQLIGGEWTDGTPVTFGPSGSTWSEIAAQRTWDYRVVLQAKTRGGATYELFTQYMGIGKQTTEHIEVKAVADSNLSKIKTREASNAEHLDVSAQASGGLTYGLSSMPLSVNNEDDGSGNCGLVITVVMDYPVTNVSGNSDAFVLMDSNGTTFSVLDAFSSEDGKIITLTTVDFNSARGDITVTYTPGSILSPAVAMEAWSFTFTPSGLVTPDIDPPVPVELWNIDRYGTKVAVRFTEAIVAGMNSVEGWSAAINTYNYVPGGTIHTEDRTITEITGYAKVADYLDVESANLTNTQLFGGEIILEVDE